MQLQNIETENGIRIFFEGKGEKDNAYINGEIELEYEKKTIAFNRMELNLLIPHKTPYEQGRIKFIVSKNGLTIGYRDSKREKGTSDIFLILKLKYDSKIQLSSFNEFLSKLNNQLINGNTSKDEIKRLVNEILAQIIAQFPMNGEEPNELIIKNLFEYIMKMTDSISSFLVFLRHINN